MPSVFILFHSHDEAGSEEEKLVGVYATPADAQAAKSRAEALPGFRDFVDGFEIVQYEIGADHWREGFVRLTNILMPLLDEGTPVWRPVQAELLPSGLYAVSRPTEVLDERWAFPPGSVVECEWREFDGDSHLVAVRRIN